MTEELKNRIAALVDENGLEFWRAAYELLEHSVCECGRLPEIFDGEAWATCNRCLTCWPIGDAATAMPADLTNYRLIEPVLPIYRIREKRLHAATSDEFLDLQRDTIRELLQDPTEQAWVIQQIAQDVVETEG